MTSMNTAPPIRLTVNVVELNPYAPRPYVFTEAALCLRDSIRLAGFASEHRVNEADSRALSIVLGAVPPRRVVVERLDPRKTAVFNFEQFGSTSGLVGSEYRRWLRDRLVVDYHSHNVHYLKRENGGDQKAFELPIVPSRSVAFPADAAAGKTVDVLFFGTLSARRSEMVRRLQAAGLSVRVVTGAYGNELTPAIRGARAVLHVHFYETGLFPVARVLQPVAHGVPIICEESVFSAGSDWSSSGIVFARYDNLVAACTALMCSPAEQLERAHRAQQFAAALDFAAPFTQLLQAWLRWLGSRTPQTEIPPPAAPDAAAAASVEQTGEEPHLPTAEIEAILEREAAGLPPESHLSTPPVALVERQLGEFRLGRWAMWLLVALGLVTAWQSLR